MISFKAASYCKFTYCIDNSNCSQDFRSTDRCITPLSILFSLHIFCFSIRCQCCTANCSLSLRSRVKGAFESLLAAPDSRLNTATFGWKIRLLLRLKETFHVKLFKLFRQNRPNFFKNLFKLKRIASNSWS